MILKKPGSGDINKYRLIIFDMDGVLRKGDKSIPLAVETFNTIKKNGTRLCIITNESRKSSRKIKKELKKMGFLLDHQVELISSSCVM